MSEVATEAGVRRSVRELHDMGEAFAVMLGLVGLAGLFLDGAGTAERARGGRRWVRTGPRRRPPRRRQRASGG